MSTHSMELRREIQSLTELEYGWDGYKGRPASQENATYALKALDMFPSGSSYFDAVPGVHGDIQLEWLKDGVEIELQIIAPNNVLLWTNDPSICPDDKTIHITDSDIAGVSSRIDNIVKGRAR